MPQKKKPVSIYSWGAQRVPLFIAAVFVYVPVLLLLLATGAVSSVTGVPIGRFTMDTTTAVGAPFYIGALSKIGIILWCAAASMCFLTSSVLHRTSTGSDEKRFFLGAGLVTSVLLIDDCFLVHEAFAPSYLGVITFR